MRRSTNQEKVYGIGYKRALIDAYDRIEPSVRRLCLDGDINSLQKEQILETVELILDGLKEELMCQTN